MRLVEIFRALNLPHLLPVGDGYSGCELADHFLPQLDVTNNRKLIAFSGARSLYEYRGMRSSFDLFTVLRYDWPEGIDGYEHLVQIMDSVIHLVQTLGSSNSSPAYKFFPKGVQGLMEWLMAVYRMKRVAPYSRQRAQVFVCSYKDGWDNGLRYREGILDLHISLYEEVDDPPYDLRMPPSKSTRCLRIF